jgi:basic membrane lipoprotein Med (substrate-binding protein (PBP1-ABC) superfamily)
MMKHFYLLFFILGFLSVKAQGTLQFNQVLTLESSTSSCTVCWTVPAGKVWKVEMASSNSENPMSVFVNNRELGYLTGHAYATSSTSYWGARWGMHFPFWLQGNATLGFSGAGTSKNTTFFVIEFNVIP